MSNEQLSTTLAINAKDNTKAVFSKLNSNLGKIGKSTEEVNKYMQGLSGTLIRATTVFAAFTATAVAMRASVGAARSFGKQMAEVSTLVDASGKTLTKYKDTVESLVSTYGGTFQDATKALYDTISAGNSSVAESSKILAVANKAAIAGVSDIATSVDVITTVLNSYGRSAESASWVSDILFKTVKEGKTTLSELAPVMGQVTATAASMNVSFEEVGAVLATATAKGIRTSQAVTGLKAVLANIIKPTKDAQDMMASLGIEFSSAALKSKGFSKFFGEILDAAKDKGIESGAAMEKFFASVEGLNTILALTSGEAKLFNAKLASMKYSAGSTEEAFAKMTKTFDFQWESFLGKVKVGAKSFGSIFTDSLIGPLTSFNDNFDLWILKFKIGFYDVLDTVRSVSSGVLKAFLPWANGAFNWIRTDLVQGIADAWDWLLDVMLLHSSVPDIVEGTQKEFQKWGTLASDISKFVTKPIAESFDRLKAALNFDENVKTFKSIVSSIKDTLAPTEAANAEVKEIKSNIGDVAAIFAVAGVSEGIKKFFGVGVITIVLGLLIKLQRRLSGVTAAFAAKRAVTNEALALEYNALKQQEKFMQDKAKFDTNYGKTLAKIKRAGGSRSAIAQLFGGSDEWILAKAKAKDAIETAKKSVKGLSEQLNPKDAAAVQRGRAAKLEKRDLTNKLRGLSIVNGQGVQSKAHRDQYGSLTSGQIRTQVRDARVRMQKLDVEIAKAAQAKKGKARYKQSFASKAMFGDLSKKEIKRRLKESQKTIIQEERKLSSKAGKGLFSRVLGLGPNLDTSSIAKKLVKVSDKAAEYSRNKSASYSAAAANAQYIPNPSSLDKLKAFTSARAGGFFQEMNKGFQKIGNAAQSYIRIHGMMVGKLKAQTKLGQATVGLAQGLIFGAKGVAAGTSRIVKGISYVASKARTLSSRTLSKAGSGLMAAMILGPDIKNALSVGANTKANTGSAAKDLASKIGAGIKSMSDVALASMAMFGPVGMALATASLVYKHWDTITDISSKVTLGGIAALVASLWKDVLLPIGKNFWEWIKAGFGKATEFLGFLAFRIANTVREALSNVPGLGDIQKSGMKNALSSDNALIKDYIINQAREGNGPAITAIRESFDAFTKSQVVEQPNALSIEAIQKSMSTVDKTLVMLNATLKNMPSTLADSKGIILEKQYPNFKYNKQIKRMQRKGESITGFANGGFISGSGTKTSDSIPAMLSNGEYVVNAEATSKFKPLLDMINKGNIEKKAKGGLMGRNASLEAMFEKTNSVSATKNAFTQQYGSVDFSSIKSFLNTLEGLKLSEKDIEAFSPSLLEAIRRKMDNMRYSVEQSFINLEGWTEEQRTLKPQLKFATQATAQWQADVEGLVGPLLNMPPATKSMTKAIEKANDAVNNFADNWKNTIQRWYDENTDKGAKGAKAAQMFTQGIDSVVNALVEGDSVKDAARQTIIGWAKESAKDGIKTMLSEMFSKTNLKDAGAGNIFASIFKAMFGGPKGFAPVAGFSAGNGTTGYTTGAAAGPGHAFAAGGIPPVNEVSLVGEKGPELFVPSTRGRIFPNNKLGSSRPSVTLNQTLNINEAMNPQGFQEELARNNEVVVAMVEEAYMRRGSNSGPYGSN